MGGGLWLGGRGVVVRWEERVVVKLKRDMWLGGRGGVVVRWEGGGCGQVEGGGGLWLGGRGGLWSGGRGGLWLGGKKLVSVIVPVLMRAWQSF